MGGDADFNFVDRHSTIARLALAVLVMIGGNLIVEGFGHYRPKGYTYFAKGSRSGWR